MDSKIESEYSESICRYSKNYTGGLNFKSKFGQEQIMRIMKQNESQRHNFKANDSEEGSVEGRNGHLDFDNGSQSISQII